VLGVAILFALAPNWSSQSTDDITPTPELFLSNDCIVLLAIGQLQKETDAVTKSSFAWTNAMVNVEWKMHHHQKSPPNCITENYSANRSAPIPFRNTEHPAGQHQSH
jgi:hypothetical protein